MLQKKTIFLILAVIFTIIGCKSNEKPSEPSKHEATKIDSMGNKITSKVDQLLAEIEKYKPQADDLSKQSQAEVEKLFTFEYLSQDFPLELSSEDLQTELQKLGNQRWECFQILIVKDKIRAICKRHPKTYLRYIPKVF